MLYADVIYHSQSVSDYGRTTGGIGCGVSVL
jgi:hypothetical protein